MFGTLRVSDTGTKRGRGHPPKSPTDLLRARAWYWAVNDAAHVGSAYALEKQFADREHLDGEPWVCTGAWRQYRRGRVPNAQTVEKVAQRYPQTRIWLELPFWEISNSPAPPLERIYELMASLRSDISTLLFYDPASNSRLERRILQERHYDVLDRKSDVEALTACVGLCREAEYLDNPFQHAYATRCAMRIFLRLAIFCPLVRTAHLILFHLAHHVFPTSISDANPPQLHGIDLYRETIARTNLILMLEDCCLLKQTAAVHRACLYLSDEYGLPKALREIEPSCRAGEWQAMKATRFAKWFVRRMRTFPFTQSCLD